MFVAFWILEVCWQITYTWRVFWNGMVIPLFDLFRARLFWRAVEKARLIGRRTAITSRS